MVSSAALASSSLRTIYNKLQVLVTCFLQGNLQQRQNQQDRSSSLKGGGGDNYMKRSPSKDKEITSPIYNTDFKHVTSSPDTKLRLPETITRWSISTPDRDPL